MMLDKQACFSEAQNLAQAAGTYLGTNAYDQGAAALDSLGNTIPKDMGRSYFTELLVQVTETFTSGGAGTLQVNLITDDAEALGSPTIIQSTPVLALATLKAGYQFRLQLPGGLAERYLGVQYVIGTATMTAGKVTAGLLANKQTAPGVSG
jgi:hypothetical protein